MKNVIRKTLPLVLLAACELPKDSDSSSTATAAAARSSAKAEAACFEPARFALTCTEVAVNSQGYANAFCDANLDIDDPALVALKDSIQVDFGEGDIVVAKGAFHATALGLTDVQMEGMTPWDSGVLTNGAQYVGITITNYSSGELQVGGCQ